MKITLEDTLIVSASFIVGVGEAMLYYNMGQAALEGKKFVFKLPPTKEFFKTAGIVFVTSVITAWMFQGLEKMLKPEEKA